MASSRTPAPSVSATKARRAVRQDRKVLAEFRRAVADDLPSIVRLLADDPFGATREHVDGGSLHDGYRRAFASIDADPRQLLVVGTIDGEVVSTLQLSFLPNLTFRGGERAQIEAVRVAARLRGSGVGGEMMRWSIEEARSRGCHLVQLTTDKERPEARRFYERLGFVASHEGMKLALE